MRYYATGTEAKLAVCSLNEATTPVPVASESNRSQAQHNIDSISAVLDRALQTSTLREQDVVWDNNESCVEHFALSDESYCPFLMRKICCNSQAVGANRASRSSESIGKHPSMLQDFYYIQHGHSEYEDELSLQPLDISKQVALVLGVSIDRRNLMLLNSETQTAAAKVDVFVDGEFCGVQLLRPAYHNEFNCQIRFSGLRSGSQLEHAWLLNRSKGPVMESGLATYQAPQTMAKKSQECTLTAQRWREIANKLRNVSTKSRSMTNGKQSPSASYLSQLSQLKLPESLNCLQRPGGFRFSVIDIVISLGNGTKTHTPWIRSSEMATPLTPPPLTINLSLVKRTHAENTEKGKEVSRTGSAEEGGRKSSSTETRQKDVEDCSSATKQQSSVQNSHKKALTIHASQKPIGKAVPAHPSSVNSSYTSEKDPRQLDMLKPSRVREWVPQIPRSDYTNFQIPSLSEGSLISYHEDETTRYYEKLLQSRARERVTLSRSGEKAHAYGLRQIRTERALRFDEGAMLVGMRFVLTDVTNE